MIILFITENCNTCKEVIKDIPAEWDKKITVFRLKYDWENLCYRAYNSDNEPIGEIAPVDSVPTLCFIKEGKAYTGYNDIITRLTDGTR